MKLPRNFTVAIVAVDENQYMIQLNEQMSIELKLGIIKPSDTVLTPIIAEESIEEQIVVPFFCFYENNESHLWKMSFRHNNVVVFDDYIKEYRIDSALIRIDDEHDSVVPIYMFLTPGYYRKTRLASI